MHLNKGKCKVLHLGRSNLSYQYMLGVNWMESSFTEKDLGVLMDTKSNTHQKHAPVTKNNLSLAALGGMLPAR